MRNAPFIFLVALFLLAIAAALIHFYRRQKRTSGATWEDLLHQLAQVDRNSIETIALDAVNESGEPRLDPDKFSIDSSAMWNMVGGLDGLEVLERNCRVLVELAAYLQTWYPEAVFVAEQLRLNAREFEWHIGRLKGAAQTGNLQTSFADYAQRAVVTYYLMTRHLLELYQLTGFSRIAELQQAI